MNLYTKKGDGGRTSTMTRLNIPKSSPIFDLLGTLDEFTSALGVAKLKAPDSVGNIIEELQHSIISLCGEIAGSSKFASPDKIAQLEKAIDSVMETVPEFSGFILPGTSEAGAALDVARTIARRAERKAVALSQTGGVSRDILIWLNRLSDLVYALARLCDQTAPQPDEKRTAAAPSSVLPPLPSGLNESGFCELAGTLCKAVRQYARSQGVRVVAAVCDAGGNLVALQREDDAYIASIDIAANKAFTSVSLKMTTEQVGKLSQPGGPLYGIQHTNQGKIVIFGGGVPLVRDGKIVGGLGVSGGSAEQDTAFADYGAKVFEKEM